jgi:TonB-linked SusC/RagA family outer membrane protein
MRKLLFLIACFFLAGIGLVSAQSRSITGKVISADDGQPIAGATVMIKGTTSGAITNENGTFTLNVSGQKILAITYMGMMPMEVPASNNLVIKMEPDRMALEEVVVTAMGVSRSKKALGYAASTVNNEELTKTRSNDVISSLSGKIAGVQVSATSSDPGTSNSIIIRGISSLGTSNQPLFIVDGVPVTNNAVFSSDGLNNGFDYGNGANLINPDDVESMTILKGSASTALYGSRAANGVVLITTKSGTRKGKELGVEYNGGVQFSSILRLPEFQNEFGMGWDGTHTQIENGSWGPKFDGSMQLWGTIYDYTQKWKPYVAQENNLKDFFETGIRYSNSLSFNGATDNSDYFVSFSQISEDGLIPSNVDTYDKYTFSFRGSHTKDKLKLSTAVNYADQTNNFAQTGQGLTIINSLYQIPRDVSIVSLADLSDPFNTNDYYFTPYGVANPYWLIENVENNFTQSKVYGKFQADYSILKNLKATYRFGLDASNSYSKQGEPKISATVGTPNEGQIDQDGSVTVSTSKIRQLNHDFLLNFDKKVTDYDVNAMIGANINERTYSSTSSYVSDLDIPTYYDLSNSGSSPVVDEYSSIRRLIGLFGEVQLGYHNYLFLNLSARNDWSSTLPKDNNSFFYPGATLSFAFTDFLPANMKENLSFGKLRLAYGKTGNDASPYMIAKYYTQSTASTTFGENSFPLNGYNAFTLGNVLGSNTLSPEITSEFEVGGNLVFLNGRVSFDGAYYNKSTDKQIFSLNMDPASGYTAQNTNLGVVSNKGIELLLTLKPIDSKDLKWEMSFNYASNDNLVESLPEELGGEANLYGLSGVASMVAIVGKPIGFEAYKAKTDGNGHIVVNSTTGLPVQTDEMEWIGKMDYDYELGISNSITYKNFSLGFDIDIRQGGLMYSRTKDINYFVGNAIQTTYNDRNPFIVPNSVIANADGTFSENTTFISVANQGEYWTEGGTNMSSDFLIDKSYIKLRSVSLSWEMPKEMLKDLGFIQGARISLYGNNLLLFTPATNTFIDPEVSTFGNDLTGKFGEFSANPTTRKIGFNVMLKF